MKSVLLGMLGAVVALVAAAMVYPQYSDYRARAQTDSWLFTVEEVQRKVETNAERKRSLVGAGTGVERPKFLPSIAPEYFRVTNDGIIFVKGGRDGQLVVLMPSLSGSKITWACIGGSLRTMPSRCQNVP
ncbi:hypothetical protein NBRC116584_30110 [Hydrogenophaga sp. 5NK40-0174]